MSEFTPDRAADMMNGADGEASAGVEAGPGGFESAGRSGGLRRSPLWNTEPSTPITEIKRREGVSEPVAYFLRAGQKVAGSDGIPAIIDGLLGTVYLYLRQTGGESGEEPATGDVSGVPDGAGKSWEEL